MQVELLKQKKTFKSKDGKELTYYQVYVNIPNYGLVAVKPCFDNDKTGLKRMATEIQKGDK